MMIIQPLPMSVIALTFAATSQSATAFQPPLPNRRNAIKTAFKWLSVPSAVTTLLPNNEIIPPASAATAATEKEDKATKSGTSSDFTVYQVIPDASEALSPTIKTVKVVYCNFNCLFLTSTCIFLFYKKDTHFKPNTCFLSPR